MRYEPNQIISFSENTSFSASDIDETMKNHIISLQGFSILSALKEYRKN